MFDGEGITDRETNAHRYVMLCNSRGDYVLNPDGLDSVECMDFLVDTATLYPHSWFVGFAFNYDANMILANVPRVLLARLWEGETVLYVTHESEYTLRGFRIMYRPRKEFAITRVVLNKRTRTNVEPPVTCRVFDIFGFFQSSFVKALERNGIVAPEEIARMKQQRSQFAVEDIPDMLRYCDSECQYGEALCESFAADLQTAGIKLRRYDGAGSIAAALFRDNGVAQYRAKTHGKLARAVQSAYYGGRIELAQYGHARDSVYQYDIRSAYPYAMAECPCLKCGEWSHETNPHTLEPFALYRVEWSMRGPMLAFPWRNEIGGVFFPEHGRGWYYGCELIAAEKLIASGAATGGFDILESWRYARGCEHEPFAWLRTLYETRARWKAEGNGAEKVLKLGINSVYGKCAQRVGARGRVPPWFQMEWSGYVTAVTRSRMLVDAIPAIKARTLIGFATDAMFTLEPMTVTLGAQLGDFELVTHTGMTAVQSGVYWTWNGEHASAKSRGFRPTELNVASVLDAWKRGQQRIETGATRFVSLGRALTGDASFAIWRQWITGKRTLNLHPHGTKRDLPRGSDSVGRRRVRPDLRMVATVPTDPHYWQSHTLESTPLALPWKNDNMEAVDTTRLDTISRVWSEAELCDL